MSDDNKTPDEQNTPPTTPAGSAMADLIRANAPSTQPAAAEPAFTAPPAIDPAALATLERIRASAPPLTIQTTVAGTEAASSAIVPATQQGIDYAQMDGDNPDDQKLAAAGERFVIIRRSHGYWDATHRAFRLAHDPTYERDAQKARDAGFVVGAYLFPLFHIGAPNAAAQVANFMAAGGEIIPGKDLPPVVDVEFPGRGIADTGMTQGQAYTFLLELITELKKATGVEPLVYTSHVQWCDSNGLGGPPDLGGHDCGLWVKIPYQRVEHSAPDKSPQIEPHVDHAAGDRLDLYRLPPPWVKSGWLVRQFQGDAWGLPGIHQADLDDFHTAREGDHALHVMWYQRRLRLVADGAFGPKTKAAVLKVQAAHGLPQTGIIDVATAAAIAWQ